MSDYKPHVVIDDQKNIILPEELKNHMVQLDHNVKTITFDCPRYSDGRDLSTMRIYVNYFRKSGEKDSDVCQNIKVDSKDTNLIHFEWVPKRSATLEAGVLAFLICAEKEDAEGNQENAWHTKLCKDLKIAEGIDCLKAVIEKYPTIITYLLTRMEDVESIATPEAMQTYVNQYLLENPPSGMTDEERALLEENIALTKQIQEDLAAVDQSKADAIICTAEGSTIVATDSAEAGFEGLHLYGRSEQVTTTGAQLLNPELFENEKYQNCNSVEDYFNIVQNADYWITGFVPVEPNKTYTTSFVPSKGAFYDESKIVIKTATVGISASLTTPDNAAYVVLNVEAGSVPFGASVMMNEGETALPWEPYTGGKPSPSADYPQEIVSAGDSGSIDTGVYGGNLLEITYTSRTANGLTFTVGDDGSIIVNGTADSLSVQVVGKAEILAGMTYRLSGCPTGGGSTYRLDARHLETSSYGGSPINDCLDYGSGAELTCSESETTNICIRIAEGTTVNNLVFKPMLCLDEIEDNTFEKYTKQILTSLTPNGLPGIKVTDASLATYTDADGQMRRADEIGFERGVYVQRIGNVNKLADGYGIQLNKAGVNGFNQYTVHAWYPSGRAPISSNEHNGVNAFCNMLPLGAQISKNTQNECFWFYGTFLVLVLNAEKYPDIDSVKDWLDNTEISLQYVLKTPIETPLSDEELAAYKALHTNKPTTTIMNSENVHMKVDYVADTKNHIKQNYVPLSEYTALEERVAAIEELVIS